MFRYKEQTAKQALILKMAHSISSLHAAILLLEAGYVQEVGVLQRVIDDSQEEIMFLGLALVEGSMESVHEKYLESLFLDDFENVDDPMSALEKKRSFVSRKDIRDAIERLATRQAERAGKEVPGNPDVAQVIGRMYSGFVHGVAPQILEMYGGTPPRYHLRGMAGTPLVESHERDLWNQFYRVSLGIRIIAIVFSDAEIISAAITLQKTLEKAAEVNYGGEEETDS